MKERILVRVTLGTVALLAGQLAPGPAQALTVRGTPVTVMNTAPDGGSIPVTGNVGIAGTANVNVTNTVPVTGTVTVTGSVANDDNPDRSPYAQVVWPNITSGWANGTASYSRTPGKRTVLKFFTVTCATNTAADTFPNVSLWINKDASSSYAVSLLSLSRAGTTFLGQYRWTGTVNMHMYSEDSSYLSMAVDIGHTDFTASAFCSASLFGYTITP